MSEPRVVHVVARLAGGGPTSSLLAHARQGGRHELLVLEREADRLSVGDVLRARIRLHLAPDVRREHAIVRAADVMILHYWNTVSVRAFLDRWRGRSLRWVLYSRVNGMHRPQMLAPVLARSAGHLVLTSPHAAHLREDGRVSVIPAVVDPDRLIAPVRPGPTIAHVGTLNVFKLDPAFVDLHQGAVVVGSGGDEGLWAARARALGRGFDWIGYDPQPWQHAGGARVFSAPTSRYTYASSDKAAQEAMMLGIPVLTYADSPLAHLVREGVTGYLAADREQYAALVAELAGREPDRSAVAAAAHEDHDPQRRLRDLDGILARVADEPPRVLDDGMPALAQWVAWQTAGARRGRPELEELMACDQALADFQAWGCEGGLAQYLNAHPELRP